MKKFLLFAIIQISLLHCIGQGKPFKEVVIDLDAHRSDSMLPIEEGFYLKFITTAATINLNNYRLLRIRKRSSGNTIYWKNIPMTNIPPNVTAENLPKPSKITSTVSVKTSAAGTENTTSTVTEQLALPVAKQTITIFVPPLTPNFYYYLVEVTATEGAAIDNGNLPIATMNLFAAITLPTTTPLGNTALSQSENMNRHISATFGLSYIPFKNGVVVPYLGLRYNFLSANKWVRMGMAEMNTQSGHKVLDRLAVDIGLTLTSIEDTTHKVKDLTGKVNVLSGLGFRVANFVFVSGGVIWYNKQDELDKNKTKIRNKFYASLSLDWDIAKTFNSFGKLLGISF